MAPIALDHPYTCRTMTWGSSEIGGKFSTLSDKIGAALSQRKEVPGSRMGLRGLEGLRESQVFLAASVHMVLYNLAEALVLNTQNVPFVFACHIIQHQQMFPETFQLRPEPAIYAMIVVFLL